LAERGEEARITCPECGRRVPATAYCIYCGVRLPRAPPSQRAAPVPPPAPAGMAAPPAVSAAATVDVRELMANISLQHARKVEMLSLLQSREVSESVFLKLYDEYTERLRKSMEVRTRMMERLRSELGGKEKRYGEVKLLLEELGVRYKIGEIALEEFNRMSDALRSEAAGLERATGMLRDGLSRLERLFMDRTPKEIYDLETRARKCYEGLKKLVEENALSGETLEKIGPDVESMLELLGSLVSDRKGRERALREELETLETRYRVGEVSIEEYENRRRELQSELEKVWA